MEVKNVLDSKSDLWGQYSRSLVLVPFNRPYTVSYYYASILIHFRDIVIHFPKCKEVAWPGTHPLWG